MGELHVVVESALADRDEEEEGGGAQDVGAEGAG